MYKLELSIIGFVEIIDIRKTKKLPIKIGFPYEILLNRLSVKKQ